MVVWDRTRGLGRHIATDIALVTAEVRLTFRKLVIANLSFAKVFAWFVMNCGSLLVRCGTRYKLCGFSMSFKDELESALRLRLLGEDAEQAKQVLARN